MALRRMGAGVGALVVGLVFVSLAPAAERVLRQSDVVFMYDNPKLYADYGCTVVGWGGKPEEIEAAHAAGVRLYCASIGFRTEASRVIDWNEKFLDAACRNFAGQPFVVPWLTDLKHKDQPYYWWCTNRPLYREFLQSRLEETMAAKPDGLHIDDYTGTAGAVTWLSACFCPDCMEGFRQYVAGRVSKEKLQELGITNLATFDYRLYLQEKQVVPEDYNSRRATLPLATEFYDYQVKSANRLVADYVKKAAELRKQPVPLCVNSGLTDPASLVIAPQVGFFCAEVWQAADSRYSARHPLYIYKLADAIDRPIAATAAGGDWATVAERKTPGLVRTWIALAYASGHNFMAPHRQWAYTKTKGTHYYEGATADYAPLYQFVRKQAALLDKYEAVAPVAVVYDNAARRLGLANIEPTCISLAEANIPFTIVAAGDDWLDNRLNPEQLARFKAVITAKESRLDAGQKQLISSLTDQGKVITWPEGRAALDRLLPQPIQVQGAEGVMVVPRAIPGYAAAPVAVHLINRRYDYRKDAVMATGPFTLKLRRDLLGGRRFTKVAFHAPQAESVDASFTIDDQWITIKVPDLSLWAIVELGS